MQLSQAALSKASPRLPIEATRPDSVSVRPKASEVYCDPLSEWWTSPAGGRRRLTAIASASTTSSAFEVVAHRPADDLARAHVHDDGEEEVALACRYVGQ